MENCICVFLHCGKRGGKQSGKQTVLYSQWADSDDRLEKVQHGVCSAAILEASTVFVAGNFSCVSIEKENVNMS